MLSQMIENTVFLDFYQNYSRHGALKKEEKKGSKKKTNPEEPFSSLGWIPGSAL